MQVKDSIMTILQDGKWKSTKDFDSVGAGRDLKRQALTILKNDGMVLSITRTEAIKKSIPVTAKGNARELYYSLNTEGAEQVVAHDDIDLEQSFNDF